MTQKYGIISDLHQQKPNIIEPAINELEDKVDSIILNGDIIGNEYAENKAKRTRRKPEQEKMDYLARILESLGESGIETYVQPGSHESLGVYENVINPMTSKHSNIKNAIELARVEEDDHDLLFLPGSDVLAEGEYPIKNDDNSTGYYSIEDEDLRPAEDLETLANRMNNNGKEGIHVTNMEDIKNYVDDPERTVLFSHVPRIFDSENTVDRAYFAQPTNGKKHFIPGIKVENIIREEYSDQDLSQEEIREIAREEKDLELKRDNQGNKNLREVLEDTMINKNITGHFHESVHNANNTEGEYVRPGEESSELFYNASCLDDGKLGVVRVEDDKISYENINL